MSSYELSVNGKLLQVTDVDPSTPLLWVLRDSLGLVGTKYGCGGGYCGCCTVHLDGQPIRSCTMPVSAVAGKKITTIEGLADRNGFLHPLQQAWIAHDVPQCGYCQAGQIMSAAGLLNNNQTPSGDEIDKAMAGNLCRCGSYKRIKAAIHTAAKLIASNKRDVV